MLLLWKSPSDILQTVKRYLHNQVNKGNSDSRQHPMWQEYTVPVPPDHSGFFEESVIPLHGHCKVDRTCYYVKVKGQIWIRDKMRMETAWILLQTTMTVPEKMCSHGPNPELKTQTPCLASTPIHYCLQAPAPICCSLIVSFWTNMTSHTTFQNKKSIENTGRKIRGVQKTKDTWSS